MITMSTKMFTWCQGQDIVRGDMTGVLVQCTFANTPVVSPESKNPARAGFSSCSNCSLLSTAVVAQLCQA